MIKFSELSESLASETAKKLGLEYYGFARYGKNKVATHKSVGGILVPITKEEIKKQDDLISARNKAEKEGRWEDANKIHDEIKDVFRTRDFRIPEENFPDLAKKIEKLNRTAKKLNQPPLKIVKHGEPKLELVKKGNPNADDPSDRHDIFGKYQYITVEGESPKLNGWQFNAKLESHEGTVLVHSVPGKSVPLKYSQATTIECEHCKKNVRRNDTFVLQKGDETIQVGRSCLKDFLGHADPGDLARWAETIHDLEGSIKDYEDEDISGRGYEHYFPTKEVLANAFTAMKRDGGFKPSSFDISTKSAIWNHYFRKADKYLKTEDIKLVPTPAEEQKAKDAIEWLKTEHGNDTDDFWMNLNKLVNVERVKTNHFGYVAALAGQYEKHLGHVIAKKKQQEGIVDVPLGNTGDRVKFEAEIIAAFKYTGRSFSYYDSGVRTVYTMRTTDGKLVKWFASSNEFKKGDMVTGKGTVKSVDIETYDRSPFKGHTVSTIGRGTFEVKSNKTEAPRSS